MFGYFEMDYFFLIEFEMVCFSFTDFWVVKGGLFSANLCLAVCSFAVDLVSFL